MRSLSLSYEWCTTTKLGLAVVHRMGKCYAVIRTVALPDITDCCAVSEWAVCIRIGKSAARTAFGSSSARWWRAWTATCNPHWIQLDETVSALCGSTFCSQWQSVVMSATECNYVPTVTIFIEFIAWKNCKILRHRCSNEMSYSVLLISRIL